MTPLLLYHESPKVRRRALAALGDVRSDIAQQWIPHIRRMLGDGDAGVRAAAIGALSSISQEDAASFARPLLADPDPRIRATAAVAMTASSRPEDVDQAESTLLDLTSDSSDSARAARRDVAIAIRQIADPRFRRLLIPLLYDSAPDVADEAMESVHASKVQGVDDFIFVPTLVSLLRNRRLKGRARAALVGYGEPVVDSLAFFLRDPEEDIWVRRHIPGTLAQIPSQKTIDVLVAALDERDGFIRYKVVSALERLRREHPELTLEGEPIEKLAIQEARRYFNFLSLHDNLFGKEKLTADSLLSQGLLEQMTRLAQPDLQAADAHSTRPPTSTRRGGRSSTATRAAFERVGIPRQHPLERCSASRCCRCSRTCRARNVSVAATCSSRRVRVTSRKRSCNSSTTTTPSPRRRQSTSCASRRCGASPTTSSTCWRTGT